MADLIITAANVAKGAAAQLLTGTAGATITAGQVVYIDTNSNAQLSKANGTAPQKVVAGIALAGASSGQPFVILIAGNINPGAAVVVGTAYFMSGTNAGGIAPVTDLAAGWYVWLLGIATSTTNIALNLWNSGAQM